MKDANSNSSHGHLALRYFAGKGAAGIAGLAAPVLLSRLVSPDDYGLFSIVSASAAIASVALFHWLGVGVYRFYDSFPAGPLALLRAAGFTFLAVAVVAVFSVLGLGFGTGALPAPMLLAASLLLVSRGWWDVSVQVATAAKDATRYGFGSVLRSFAWLGCASLGVVGGGGALALVAARAIADAVGAAGVAGAQWRSSLRGQRALPRKEFGKLLSYGGPLTIALVFSMGLAFADRYFLLWMIGEGEVGAYSVSYDVCTQIVGVVFSVVAVGSRAVVFRTFESEGAGLARVEMAAYLKLLLRVALLPVACLVLFGRELADAVLGAAYVEVGASIIPLVALGSFFAALRAQYCDLVFHLEEDTRPLIGVLGVALVVNAVLNGLLIPVIGVRGAALATVASYALALVLSGVSGWRKGVVPYGSLFSPAPLVATALIFLGYGCSVFAGDQLLFARAAILVLIGGLLLWWPGTETRE